MIEQRTGFQLPQVPQDEWTAKLYERYGLGTTPSLEKIEDKATELLSSPSTVLTGAELVLGRRISGNFQNEPEVLPLIATPGPSGKERFGLLLMQKSVEDARARKTEE